MTNLKQQFISGNAQGQTKQNQNEKVETTMTNQTQTTQNETMEANTPVSAEQATAQREVPKRSLGKFREQGANQNYDKNWFKSREDALAVVQDDFEVFDQNGSDVVDFSADGEIVPAHGILKMYVNAPTLAQFQQMGTVAVVNIQTVVGTIRSISVRENQYGGLSAEVQQRSFTRNGKTEYVSDTTLASHVKAQILTVVDAMLVDTAE